MCLLVPLVKWCHICAFVLCISFPMATSQCVCVHSCALHFALLIIQCAFACVSLFLGPHPSVCVCVCMCMAVPFFLQNNSSELMWVHLLLVIWVHLHVHLYSLGHIPVRVFVCVRVQSCALLFADNSIWFYIVAFACVSLVHSFLRASFPGATFQYEGVYAWLCSFFCKIIPSDLTWVLSLVRLLCIRFECLFSLDHIPVRVLLWVCKWLCSSFCIIIQVMSFLCIRWCFFFPWATSQCVCVCVHGCALLFAP
jgi:hypothetical protein